MKQHRKNEGILILSHQGFSFLEDLFAIAEKLGLESYVLSSLPALTSRHRIGHIRSHTQWSRIRRLPELTSADVTDALSSLKREGKQVLACVSVWEGYRRLMAQANQLLCAPDLTPDTVSTLVDKFTLRKKLNEAGLSQVKCEVLTNRLLKQLPKDYLGFVKPRQGLGSFAAFSFTGETTVAMLSRIRREMKSDYEYANIFGTNPELIIEDFIGGTEVSFEVLVTAGTPHIVAIHEKFEVERQAKTTLENVSVAPPVSISALGLKKAETWIPAVLKALNCENGCFHVEAKWDERKSVWEIIEVNPRIGGALIKESIRKLTGEFDLIEGWIRSLVARTPSERRALDLRVCKAEQMFRKRSGTGTLFRVFFGQPGKKIEKIREMPVSPSPSFMRLAVKAGTRLPKSSREIFLGQGLWKFPRKELKKTANRACRASRQAIEVTYA